MSDVKLLKLPRRRFDALIHMLDEPIQAMIQLADDFLDLAARAFDDHLDAAIGQVAYEPVDVVLHRDDVSRTTESHSLYASAEITCPTLHDVLRCTCHSGFVTSCPHFTKG